MKKLSLTIVAIAAGALLFALTKHPAPTSGDAWADRVSETLRVAFNQVDHSLWGRLLKKYVDENGMVDYETWKNTPGDVAALDQYLAVLGRGSPETPTSKEGRLAFWINAYNALTVHGILKVYPTSSIRNHTARVVGTTYWHDLPIVVAEKNYSLDFIEHKILRKLDEPRIHFAIVCASIGCPRLLNEAYAPAKLESQLERNVRDFFSRKQHFEVDLAKRQVRVSSIIDWFGEDFGPTPQKALATLARYVPEGDVRSLIVSGDFSVSYLDYDWALNKQ